MAFELPKLPYAYSALEPHIDSRTMEIHHTKHHQAYVTNLNNALAGNVAENWTLDQIMAGISKLSTPIRNNGGGHYNHSLFWETMAPNAGGAPTGELGDAITNTFGSFDKFKEEFAKAAAGRFGSGWAWLIKHDGLLAITSTPNQDNPLMDIAEVKGFPLLGLDVWEHAYYLHYQNRRPDYVSAWWNVVNWNVVAERFRKG